MKLDTAGLIGSYLDETLLPDEFVRLQAWLKECPENAQQFTLAVLLHDRLRSEVPALAAMRQANALTIVTPPTRGWRPRYRSYASNVSVVIMSFVAIVLVWKIAGESPASAAANELSRIIAVNAQRIDRTYRITVENEAPSGRVGNRPPEQVSPRRDRSPAGDRGPRPTNERRPPKPPLNGATLHVRGNGQFVLIRTTSDGLPFITGSNGRTSWAVRPDGPVRFSSDLTRFNRDVPGHEHSVPLLNIQEGLIGLLEAYDVELQSATRVRSAMPSERDVDQVLVATKKSGAYRGPKRVEITYTVGGGMIQRMRFFDMPYGDSRPLTLQIDLLEERALGADFFDHQSHHTPARVVEFEE